MLQWLIRPFSLHRASTRIGLWRPDTAPPETCVREVRRYFSRAEPTKPMITAGVTALLASHKQGMTESELILLAARVNRAMEKAK